MTRTELGRADRPPARDRNRDGRVLRRACRPLRRSAGAARSLVGPGGGGAPPRELGARPPGLSARRGNPRQPAGAPGRPPGDRAPGDPTAPAADRARGRLECGRIGGGDRDRDIGSQSGVGGPRRGGPSQPRSRSVRPHPRRASRQARAGGRAAGRARSCRDRPDPRASHGGASRQPADDSDRR